MSLASLPNRAKSFEGGEPTAWEMGLKRRRQPEILRYLQAATGPWLECPAGISAWEKTPIPPTLVQEAASGKAGLRVFVVHSDEGVEI